MLTRYTKPPELIDEFCKDYERAKYWLMKNIERQRKGSKSHSNFRQAYYNQKKDCRSEVFEYESPLYGNKWLLWYRYQSTGYAQMPKCDGYMVCYQMTEAYMNVMIPTRIDNLRGMSIFTDHLFQRMADEDRLGVDMSDRKLVIRNFAENVLCGIINIRDPRKGERDDQIICRMPGSFLKGHIRYFGDYYVSQFNTFLPEKGMTPAQRNYLKSFTKFADSFTSKDDVIKYFNQKEKEE